MRKTKAPTNLCKRIIAFAGGKNLLSISRNSNSGFCGKEMAANEGQVIGCHTVEQWNEQLQKAFNSNKLVVVDFTATWCPPCRLIAPIFVELAKKWINVLFLKVDVDELKSVAEDYTVEAMPTFIVLKEGSIVDKVVGARKEELAVAIAKHASAPSTATATA